MSEKPLISKADLAGDIAVDDGFRRWYASCPCCLGESYPEVKAKIETEKGVAQGS